MLTRHLLESKSATSTRLKKFALALRASDIFLSRADQLVFLCGANQPNGRPSARRSALRRVIEGLGYRVVYAEGVFRELAKDHRRNVLDLEHEITAIADKIVIILESESAFCELGAFTHQDLRKKLVVVNDAQFRYAESFINTGPIAALEEVRSPVLWYPMRKNGTAIVDGIGAIFADLRTALSGGIHAGSVRITEDLASLKATKSSLYFVHDLVLFAGPITHDELILLFKLMFGDRSFDRLKRLVGVLRSAGVIDAGEDNEGTRYYKALSSTPYLRYSANVYALTAAFRVQHMKTSPDRFAYA